MLQVTPDASALYCRRVAPTADPFLHSLGRRVRAARAARAWTLSVFAERVGLSERFLHDLEAGRGNISVANLKRVADALAVPIDRLVAEIAPESDSVERSRAKIALVGLRGAGKTTIGRALAKRLRAPFVELDRVVEDAAGMKLADLFATHGEPYYRRLERDVVLRLLAKRGRAVIATGGGIVNDPETWRELRDRCLTIWLEASPRDHWERVVAQGDRRPMADNPRAMTELRALLRARRPLYALAHRRVDTSRLGLDAAIDAVVSAASGGAARAKNGAE